MRGMIFINIGNAKISNVILIEKYKNMIRFFFIDSKDAWETLIGIFYVSPMPDSYQQ